MVAEFFDIGQSRTLAWARRLQAAALVAALADAERRLTRDATRTAAGQRGRWAR
jgi:hypothetical protein